jgi:hypothetical protein
MIVIGISTNKNNCLSACFIKNRANDFIYKKFTSEEFYCRSTQNITAAIIPNLAVEISLKAIISIATGIIDRR